MDADLLAWSAIRASANHNQLKEIKSPRMSKHAMSVARALLQQARLYWRLIG